MIDVDGLDDAARAAVGRASAAADELRAERIGTEHLLLGVLGGDDATARTLAAVGATPAAVRAKVAEASGGRRPPTATGTLELTPRATRALARAHWYSHRAKAEHVGARHVLLGVLDIEGTAGQVLRGVGADLGALRTQLTDAGAPAPSEPAAASPAAVDPRCGSCGTVVDELAFRVVRATDADGRAGDAVVFSCRGCGVVLGVARARDASA